MKLSIPFIFVAIAFAIAGCSHREAPYKGPPLYMLYSPNGEPLNGGPLGRPTCEQAVKGWFDRLSANYNRVIPQDAFMRDAGVQFRRMDIDRNGYIVSEELDRFREPYRQQPALMVSGGGDESQDDSEHRHKKGSGRSAADSKTIQADRSFTSSDSVMSADTNLDFKVTPEEFMTQAKAIFAKLDANNDGVISHEEIAILCKSHEEKP